MSKVCKQKSLIGLIIFLPLHTCKHYGVNVNKTIPLDTIEEFNVDSKAKCDRLNLAHVR